MEALQNYAAILKNVYSDSFIALFVFAAIFFVVRGKSILKMPTKGTLNEVAHNLLLLILNGLLGAAIFGNLSFLSNLLFETLSLPHIEKEFWGSIPSIFILTLALFAMDFQNYWAHRLLHTKYFWGIHALHHSDRFMTWTTSFRIHILEWVLMSFVYITLVGWLFLPPEIIAIVAFIRIWHSKLIHCQLGWTFGPLRKVLASPNYHRWHHSIEKEAHDKNFCDMFPIWDILFKTHHDPGLCETEIGVEDMPDSILGNQLYPFKYTYEAIKTRLPARQITQSRTSSR